MNKKSSVISGLIILGMIYNMAIAPSGRAGGVIQLEERRVVILADDWPLCSDALLEIANEQTTEGDMQWNQTYGGAGSEEAWAVIQTADGGFALAGWTESFGAGNDDFWLMKTDAHGEIQWHRPYGGADSDRASAIIQTADGGFALAGYTGSFGAGGEDFWLVKTDAHGEIQWQQTYGGSDQDGAFAVIQTADGGFALTGWTRSYGVGKADFWLVKTDAHGAVEWNQTYGGSGDDFAFAVIETMDGGFAVAGRMIVPENRGWFDAWLVKTYPNGTVQWNQTYGDSGEDDVYAIIETADGGYALAAYTTSYGAGDRDGWLVKTDAKGNEQWIQTYGGSLWDGAHSVIQTADGGFALAGYTGSYGAGKSDFWLVKTDAHGEIQWQQTYGGSDRDGASAVIQTADGGFALAGYTRSFGAGGYDAWLVKIESTDTDGDGLANVAEVDRYGTNPTVVDTDGDGLGDGAEVLTYKTNPLVTDTDGDDLTDGEEVTTYGTDPTVADTDGDGLIDSEEVLTYETNPLVEDTDGDEFSDGEEVTAGTNPQDPAEHPSTTPGTATDTKTTVTTDTPAAFIPGFTLGELGLALACLVILARRITKR